MKKFFMFAAMASVVLASCVKNEPVATVEQGDLITFNSPVVAPATKAEVAYNGADFNAYAYYSTTTPYAGNGTAYINGSTFTDKGTHFGGKDASYYWPKDGYLSFVAYAPTTVTVENTTGPSQLVLSYEVPDNGNSVDVLYSTWNKDQTSANQIVTNPKPESGNWTGIDIEFHHALAAVNFTVKAKDAAAANAITIKKITLGTLKNAGTLTCPYNATAAWDPTTGSATYTVSADTGTGADSKKIKTEGEDYAAYKLLPQSLTGVNVTVDYYLKGDEYLLQQEVITLATAKDGEDNTVDTWVMGKRYNYTLIFGVDEIKLSPVVVDWEDVDVEIETTL